MYVYTPSSTHHHSLKPLRRFITAGSPATRLRRRAALCPLPPAVHARARGATATHTLRAHVALVLCPDFAGLFLVCLAVRDLGSLGETAYAAPCAGDSFFKPRRGFVPLHVAHSHTPGPACRLPVTDLLSPAACPLCMVYTIHMAQVPLKSWTRCALSLEETELCTRVSLRPSPLSRVAVV